MLKHIVVFKMKPGAEGRTREENLAELKSRLEALPGQIPEVQKFDVGVNINPSGSAYDIALYTEFEDMMGLLAYQKHPAHQDVLSFISKVCDDRRVVDWE